MIKRKRAFLQVFLLALGICSAQAGAAEKTVAARGQSVVSDNSTLAQAKSNALNQARAMAVEKASGVSLSTFTILENNLVTADWIKSFSRGVIVDEKIIAWDGSWLTDESSGPGYPVLNVAIEARVLIPDPSFYRKGLLKVSTNASTYKNGEHAVITVTVMADMYILLANYTAAGNMVHIFPARYDHGNFLVAGSSKAIPGEKHHGVELTLVVPHGYLRSTEAFMVWGLPKTPITDNLDWITLFEENREIPYAEYMRKVFELSPPWLSEDVQVYTISAN